MRKIIFLFQWIVFVIPALAQDKLLSIEDAVVNNRTTLAPENLRQLQFVFNTDDYVYVKRVGGMDTWMKGNFKSKSEQPFLSLEQLNQKLRTAGVDTLAIMPSIQFNSSSEWIINLGAGKIALNPAKRKSRTIIDKSIAQKQIVDESMAGYVAFVDNFNLFVTDGKTTKQVT